MANKLRIGTRDSKLAWWQALKVQDLLTAENVSTELTPIKSEGDINLISPLYELGVQGIFTKALDIALLNDEVDIAVHSYKDVPTQLARGLTVAAVLKRDNPVDILIARVPGYSDEAIGRGAKPIIATSSIRRRAQWKHHFPKTEFENIRGNIISRLEKLEQSNWDGAIFAAAGLERLDLLQQYAANISFLQWMVPAPAQGAIVVLCKNDNETALDFCKALHHQPTDICIKAERAFLKNLQGGCSTPISAFAQIMNNELDLKVNVTSVDGSASITKNLTGPPQSWEQTALAASEELKQLGALNILNNTGHG